MLATSFNPIPGVVLTSIGATTGDQALAGFFDSNGKIVVAGRTWPSNSPSQTDFAALRFQADGALDSTFGSGGAVVTPVSPYGDSAYAAVEYPATPTDKIVLAGYAQAKTGKWGALQSDFALARYNGDGSLDRTFNYQPPTTTKKTTTPEKFGIVQTDLGGGYSVSVEAIQGALVQDGKIVAAGRSDASGATRFIVARYTSTGQLDTSFNGTGVVTTSFGGTWDGAAGVALQQGKILAVGTARPGGGATNDFALARYMPNGTLDNTFGQDMNGDGVRDGKAVTDLGADDTVSGLAVDGSDQSIVVIGNHSDVDACHFALARYLPEGTLDTAFGTNGMAVTNLGRRGSEPRAVAIDAVSRKIIAVGRTDDGRSDFAVGRFNSNGTLDSTFGTGGAVFTPILQKAVAMSALIQSDGKIVVSGYAVDAANRTYVALARYHSDGTLDSSFGSSTMVGTSVLSAGSAEGPAVSSAAANHAALTAAAMVEPATSLTPTAAGQENAAGDSGVPQPSATAADMPRPTDAQTAILGRTKQPALLDGSQRHQSAVDVVLGDLEADLLADELAAVLVP